MTTTTDTSLRIERTYNASPEQVFAALTDPDKVKQWFAPDPSMDVPIAEFDLRVGGEYRIVMKGEQVFSVGGSFKEITPPDRLVFTWAWEGDPAESIVTYELAAQDGQTALTLTHEKLSDAESTAKHEHGWNACLDRLPEVL